MLLIGTDGLAFCDDRVVGEEPSSAFMVENSCSSLLDCRYLFFENGDVYLYMEMLSFGCPWRLWRHILYILIEPSDKEVHEDNLKSIVGIRRLVFGHNVCTLL